MPAEPPRYTGPEYREALKAPAGAPLDPMRPPRLYRLVVTLASRLIPVFFRLRVTGLEQLPPPPYLIAANHQAWYDAMFILAAFPRRPMVATMGRRDTVFNRAWKRWLMARLGVFAISPNRGELDQEGVASVYRALAAGGVVLIFPEGRYSRGRRLLPLKKGVGHFALEAGVPIVPVAVTGLDRLRPWGLVEVTVAPPVHFDAPFWWSLNQKVAHLVERVGEAIQGAMQATGNRGELGRRWLKRLRFRRRRL